MFQLLGAASASGYIITALFLLVAIGRLARNVLHKLTARLPKRSALKHYTTAIVSLVFFCLTFDILKAEPCRCGAGRVVSDDRENTTAVDSGRARLTLTR
ncbi:hypothetical protein [Rhizobium ruizarguesonis]|uniref:hypothetical protein n=1 Tax=Rhizobium ruizarguesonis TaxID=2081791 RepID=UPI001FE00549|nr:hypothetical protein [Rhizobium ruizarguesonis]